MTTITFERWRERFEKTLVVGTRAWAALRTCTDYAKQHASTLPAWLIFLLSEDPDWAHDIPKSILKLIYRVTLPPPQLIETKKNRDARTRRALRNLTMQAEKFVTHLKKMAQADGTPGGVFVSGNHSLFLRINLSPLLVEYQSVAETSRYFLAFLEKPAYLRKPDIFDNGIGLIGVLEDWFEVPEVQALELARLALLAHGHPEDKLEDMRDLNKIGAGNFRKRKQARQQRNASLKDLALRNPHTKEAIKLQSITFMADRTGKI